MNQIYILRHELNNAVSFKIGRTTNLQKRLSQFKTFPGIITVHKTFLTEFSVQIEKFLHNKFLSQKDKGEWYNLTENNIKEIENIIEEQTIILKNKNALKDKKNGKVTVTYSISEAGYKRLQEFVDDNCIDKSKLIEKLILKHIEQ